MKRPSVVLLLSFAFALYVSSPISAQLAGAVAGQNVNAGQNINMVSGTVWPAGDQFLQRQNEPSMAVSNRNPEHLLAGANDYRTVDIANPGAPDYRGDAWLGVFTSIDGGDSWKSTPLPGYPQDKSAIGVASPLHPNYSVATDPTVRAGTDGMVYYSGLAFNRGTKAGSAVFVSTFQDLNNKGNGNGPFEQQANASGSPFLYLNTVIVDTTSNQFVDKPWIAVDVPRPGRTAMCTVNGQTFTSGYVYLFYTFFNGSTKNPTARINVAVSTTCGASWSRPQTISQSSQLNQGTVAGIDPGTGNVYVSWRQEGNGTQNQPDQILFAYSTNGGGSWITGTVYTFPNSSSTAGAFDLDENTSGTQFRSEGIPSLAVDGYGRVWVAFSQKVAVSGASGTLPGSRIYVTTFPRGGGSHSWTTPYPIDSSAPTSGSGATYGHQLMPSFSYAYGRLMLIWLDTRWDNQQQVLEGCTSLNTCTIMHSPIPNSFLASGSPQNVFTPNVTDPIGGGIRHTVDVFGSMLMPSSTFNSPTIQAIQISQYKFYFNTTDSQFEQANFFPPNLPMFVQGTQPFIGDYLDVAAVTMVPNGNSWTFNTDSSNAPVFHATWTDNRDVVPPPILLVNGAQTQDWTQYSPPGASSNSPSIFLNQPGMNESNCQPGYSGDRNQNVYTSRITAGLIVRFKENAKPLTTSANGAVKLVQRSFSLYVRNTVPALANPNPALYRILIGPSSTTSIIPPPTCNPAISGGTATFADGSCQLDVAIPPRTTISRAIVVNSSNSNASVNVLVAPINTIGGNFSGGIQATAALNNYANNPGVISDPDQITFDPTDPDFSSPYSGLIQLANGEFYDPTTAGALIQGESSPSISSPSISSPSIASPSIASPSIASPSIASPSIASPSITAVQTASPSIVTIPNSSPSIASPSIASPSIVNLENSSPSIANPGDSATDYSFTVTNKGTTHGTYNTKEFVKQMGADSACSNNNCQLIIHRTHGSPTAAIDNNGQAACQLAVQVQDLTQANIPSPAFSESITSSADTSSSASNATITLGPGEGTRVTLRVFGNHQIDPPATFPIRAVAVGSVPDTGQTTNPASLTISTTDLPVAVVGQPYPSMTTTTNNPMNVPSVSLMSIGGFGATEWFPFNDMPTPEPQPLGVPGFSLSPSGQISADGGLVSSPVGSYPDVNVEVQDSATPVNTDAQTLLLQVNQFSISSVDVSIANSPAGGTSYLKQGDVATVTVNVSNQGPATATAVSATLMVNALLGGSPSGPPSVSCIPQTLQPVSISGGGAYGFAFTCTTNSGNGYVSFTGNASGQYISPRMQYITQATAGSVTTPAPTVANAVTNSAPPDVIVDTVNPTLTFVGTGSPAANQYGWNNTNVSFSYTTADNLSGVDNTRTPASPAVVSTEGTNQSTSVTVFDLAGNAATFTTPTRPAVMIDKTAPVVAAPVSTYTPGTWTNQSVTVSFSCSDNLSGPLVSGGITNPVITGLPATGASVTYQSQSNGLISVATVTLTAETTTSGVTLTANCQDFAGNNAQSQSFGPVLIDKTPPIVTGTATAGPNNTPYAAGTWTNLSPVTVTFSCTDSLSGPNLSSITGNTVLAGPTQNTTVNGSCMDIAGNTGNGSFVVKIDQVAPSIMITSPAPAQTFLLNSQITPVFTCGEGVGGIDTVNCVVAPSPSPYTVSPVGPGTFTVNATDQAGNVANASSNYTVIYNFSGFQPPLQPAGSATSPSNSGSFAQGSPIAFQWTLQDASSVFIADQGSLTSVTAYPNSACMGAPDPNGVPLALFSNGTPSAGSSYQVNNNLFDFTWDTTGVAPGCYNVVVTLNDTTQQVTIVNMTAPPQ